MKEVHDQQYWANYYKSGAAPEAPSLFAQHVNEHHIKPGDNIIELGCGNGRDSKFFARSNPDSLVTAVDQCVASMGLDTESPAADNLRFMTADFTTLPDGDPVDVIYSRFTLHSVTHEQQQRTLEWAHRNISEEGVLSIETRGQKNEFYKLGEKVEDEEDAYIYEDHYRRFVELGKFVDDVASAGFDVVDAEEATGFAPFKDTDQHFIRLFAKRRLS